MHTLRNMIGYHGVARVRVLECAEPNWAPRQFCLKAYAIPFHRSIVRFNDRKSSIL